jgi:hypothetical protein
MPTSRVKFVVPSAFVSVLSFLFFAIAIRLLKRENQWLWSHGVNRMIARLGSIPRQPPTLFSLIRHTIQYS